MNQSLRTIGPSKAMFIKPGLRISSYNEAQPPTGIECFETNELRIRFALRQARAGCNYFVGFINVAPNRFGLSYAYADWVGDGMYVRDLHALIH